MENQYSCIPSVIWLDINNFCNNKCKWCYEQCNDKSSVINMNIEDAEYVLDTMHKVGIKKCIIIGGEPTLNPYLFDIIALIKKYNIEVGIISNGRKFSDINFTKKIANIEFSNFVLSMHGWSEKIYETLTNSNKGFNEFLEGCLNLKKFNVKFNINTVLSRYTVNNEKEIAKFLKRLDANAVGFNIAGPAISKSIKESDYTLSMKESCNHLMKIYEVCLEEQLTFCFKVYKSRESFLEFWNSPILNQMRKQSNYLRSSECEKCSYWRICGGGCLTHWSCHKVESIQFRAIKKNLFLIITMNKLKNFFTEINKFGDLKYYYLIQIIIIFGLNLNFSIFFLYPLTFGLNFMQMMFLYFSLTQFVGFIFNIPTGIFADKYSIKLCILLGIFATALANIFRGTLPFIIEPFYAFVISEILVGFSIAILVGSSEKYLYSFNDKIKDSTIFSLISTITFWASAIGTLIGGIIVVYLSMAWTQIVGGIIVMIGGILGIIFLKEPTLKKPTQSNFSLLKDGSIFVIKNREVFCLIFGGALITLGICGSRNVFQPLLSNNGLDVKEFGWVFSIIFTLQMIFSGFGALIVSKIEKYINLKLSMFISFLFSGLLLFFLTLTGNIILISILIIIFGIFEGTQYPQYNIIINRAITNENIRATVLSIDNVVGSIGLMIFMGYIGKLTDDYGINANLYISALLFFIGSLIINLNYFRKQE